MSNPLRQLIEYRFDQSSGLPLSPTEALVAAYRDATAVLIRPFSASRWLSLSALCLVLGGGAPSAALNWSWGPLLNDLHLRLTLDQFRRHINSHPGLIVVLSAAGVALVAGVLYLRSVLRFVLVDSILKGGEVLFWAAYTDTRRQAHSYFLWLTGSLLSGAVLAGLGAFTGMWLLRSRVVSHNPFIVSAMLLGIFAGIVLAGIIVAATVTLTDDLAVPMMYAERITLFPAWRRLARALYAEPVAFTAYILVRFGLSLLVGVVLILTLFPLLLSVFSGFLILSGFLIAAAKVAGFVWVWNPLTILFASAALLLLTIIQFLVLSVIGMPGQLLLQDYGMRFIASRTGSARLRW